MLGLDEEDAQFLDQLAINKKRREAEWRAEERDLLKRFRQEAEQAGAENPGASGVDAGAKPAGVGESKKPNANGVGAINDSAGGGGQRAQQRKKQERLLGGLVKKKGVAAGVNDKANAGDGGSGAACSSSKPITATDNAQDHGKPADGKKLATANESTKSTASTTAACPSSACDALKSILAGYASSDDDAQS